MESTSDAGCFAVPLEADLAASVEPNAACCTSFGTAWIAAPIEGQLDWQEVSGKPLMIQ